MLFESNKNIFDGIPYRSCIKYVFMSDWGILSKGTVILNLRCSEHNHSYSFYLNSLNTSDSPIHKSHDRGSASFVSSHILFIPHYEALSLSYSSTSMNVRISHTEFHLD